MKTLAEIADLHREAEIELQKYPGVVGVGYGAKERGGQTTDEVAFRVYVLEKKGRGELRPEEVVPAEFKGIPTDVVIVPQVKSFDCEDLEFHSPLVGGITISNLKSATTLAVGTLGFFATINGVSGPNNVVLVSNNHVLTTDAAVKGAQIYQPRLKKEAGDSYSIALDLEGKEVKHPIAVLDNAGSRGDYSFTYPGEQPKDFWVDAATAKLNIDMSSWCDTNYGTKFKSALSGLTLNTKDKIEQVARAMTPLEVVHKVGRMTGATVGKVVEVSGLAQDELTQVIQHNVIIIEATQNNCKNEMRFSEEGDSGSPIVNAKYELVGLLFAGNQTQTMACHIHPVLDRLGITAITKAAPHPAAETLADAPGGVSGGREEFAAGLREQFEQSARGRAVAALVETHRQEVIHLVNHRRAVTVAWHRSRGPDFFAHLLNNARHPAAVLPQEIEGVGRRALVENMARVLAEHGSPALRAVIERHVAHVRAHAEQLNSLHELVEQLGQYEVA